MGFAFDQALYEISEDDITAFIQSSWQEFLEDATRLVAIESVLSEDDAALGAPFGPGPRAALDEILTIANRMGFQTHDVDGYAGYADLCGTSGQQLGIIGHVDVVPAGEGWTVPPFELTQKENVLFGRGTTDDKIPLLCALYAAKFWMDRGVSLNHTVRFIFGCNEETGMEDVSYYLARYKAPDFLFTPDADFSLCYGEKGLFGVTLTYDMEDSRNNRVVSFEGGVAANAVPALARAVVSLTPEQVHPFYQHFAQAERISLEPCEEGTLITASGVSGHASRPEGTVNAIGVLAQFLSEVELCSEAERSWFSFVARLAHTSDGSAVGIACQDQDFGALTSVVGTMRKEGSRYTVTDDIRFPTAISGDALREAFEQVAKHLGACCTITRNQEPFMVNPETASVQALMAAYQHATGLEVYPFTMGGATYAREFPHAVSFGPLDLAVTPFPDWVGEMHGADEGITTQAIHHAIRIYIRALGNLAQVEQLSEDR